MVLRHEACHFSSQPDRSSSYSYDFDPKHKKMTSVIQEDVIQEDLIQEEVIQEDLIQEKNQILKNKLIVLMDLIHIYCAYICL